MSRVLVPQDVDAERSLLATLCAPGNEHMASMWLPTMCPEDFMHPAHRAVLEALRLVLQQRQEVSSLTLKDALETQGRLGAVGGYTGLTQILLGEEVTRPEGLIEVLSKHRKRRELIRLSGRLSGLGQDTAEDPDEAIHEAQTELHRIGRDGRRSEGESWSEVLTAMASLEPFRRGEERGGWWGLPTLDGIAPIPSGEFAVLGARPGIGKTAMLTQVAVASASHGLRTLVVTLELPKESMRARLASHLSGVSVQALKRGAYAAEHVRAVGSHADTLALGRIQDPSAGTPWPRIEAMIRHEVDRYGIQLVLLDQFDKIGRPAVGKGSSEAYAFGAVSQGIMALTKELGIGFVLLCQLKGDAEGREPTLSDHADSDRPGKDGAVVLHLWRDRNGDTKAKLQKNRDGAYVGKRFDLDFHGHCQRFVEIEHTTDAPAPTPGYQARPLL